MLRINKLLHSASEKIDLYNDKISSGERLDKSQSEDFSSSITLFALLTKISKLDQDIEYAKQDTELFDEKTIQDLIASKESLEKELYILFDEIKSEKINSFIIEIRAGAGGEEASLFAKDIFESYTKFLAFKRYPFDVLDFTEADAGGYSTIIFEVRSQDAYKVLKAEGGVHRVQRVPKTESSGRIHTSTISVALLPIMEKAKININPIDLKIDVYRSSGHGGQSVNTTDSAVRITHLPSGLVVTCQNTKSQIKNKEMALKVLQARLEEIERTTSNNSEQNLRNSQIQNSDRSEKIRTYNYLQDRITDHRVKLDFSSIQKFLNGDIEETLVEINEKLSEQKFANEDTEEAVD